MRKIVFAAATLAIGFITAVALCLQALNAQPVSAFLDGSMRIVVDAGHGGIDGGVSGRRTKKKESDLNLAIALVLKDRLEDMGFDVTLTRKTEGGLYDSTAKGFKKRDMQRRKEIIQNADPALLISIHQNFYPSKATRGGQVFYPPENEEAERFALGMQSRLNELYAEKKVKPRQATKGEFFMLQCAPCPSLIVECGFLSNAEDEDLLCSAAWQGRLAESISAGVLDYYSHAVS